MKRGEHRNEQEESAGGDEVERGHSNRRRGQKGEEDGDIG